MRAIFPSSLGIAMLLYILQVAVHNICTYQFRCEGIRFGCRFLNLSVQKWRQTTVWKTRKRLNPRWSAHGASMRMPRKRRGGGGFGGRATRGRGFLTLRPRWA